MPTNEFRRATSLPAELTWTDTRIPLVFPVFRLSSRPMRSRWYVREILALAAMFGVVFAFEYFMPRVNPDGFSTGETRTYEGILAVPKEGWTFASFQSVASLKANEQATGRTQYEHICLLPDTDHSGFDRALDQAPAEKDGARALWVRIEAEPRLSTGACMYREYGQPSKRRWGQYLRVKSILSSAPIPCDGFEFIIHNRRCAGQPQFGGR